MPAYVKTIHSKEELVRRFNAVMLLAAAGDALGHNNGHWEWQKAGIIIHKEFKEISEGKGMAGINLTIRWRYSDDTAMHMATARAIILSHKSAKPFAAKMEGTFGIGRQLAIEYKSSWGATICDKLVTPKKNYQTSPRKGGRCPSRTNLSMLKVLNDDGSNWQHIPFMDLGGGCGGAVRTSCIGLLAWDRNTLIAWAIESARLTHHHPTGFMGAVCTALFTSLALEGYVEIRE